MFEAALICKIVIVRAEPVSQCGGSKESVSSKFKQFQVHDAHLFG